ncbi:MAG: hypothetical protein LBS57_07150 [Treponema sp.]|jgi:hypothetical protein|nr:hypothetical protein [Treponema sp.]
MAKRTAFLALAAALVILSCPQDTPDEDAGETDVELAKDLMGMVHAGSRAEVTAEYTLLDEMGVEWMLKDFSWSSIQTDPNTWNIDAYKTYADNAETNGKKILAILDYDTDWVHGSKPPRGAPYIEADEIPAFCEYVKRTVERYRDRVDAWCIWNEPNLDDRFWSGTREEFYALTIAAAGAIREVAPNAVIVGGAFNTLVTDDWIEGIFTSGAMEKIDFIAYHPYAPNARGTGAVYKGFRDNVARYGFADKIWVTEAGYPTVRDEDLVNGRLPGGRYGTEVNIEDMPETVTKTISLLAAAGAKKIFWYHIFDPPASEQEAGDSEDWFGLVEDDYTKKKGALAYALCAKYLPGKTWRHEGFPGAELPDSVTSCYFEGNDGSRCLVLWNESSVSSRTVNLVISGTDRLLHNVADGTNTAFSDGDYTLHPNNTRQQTLLFVTWKADSGG